jgi:hypothetical protein
MPQLAPRRLRSQERLDGAGRVYRLALFFFPITMSRSMAFPIAR